MSNLRTRLLKLEAQLTDEAASSHALRDGRTTGRIHRGRKIRQVVSQATRTGRLSATWWPFIRN